MEKRLRQSLFVMVLVSGLLSVPFAGLSQALIPFELNWQVGTLILNNGDTLQGGASLILPNDVVKFATSNGTLGTFLPSEVSKLVVRKPFNSIPVRRSGEFLHHQREYRRYNWNRDQDFGTFTTPALFVVVVAGKYNLLLREEKQQQFTIGGNVNIHLAAKLAEDRVVEKFYLALPNQQIIFLRHPQKDFLKHFPENKKAIKKFALSNRFAFDRIDHLAKIMAYCNTL